jgi:hypothetical protein
MAIIEKGATDTQVDVVDQGSTGALLVTTPGYAADGTIIGAGPAGGPAGFFENDSGSVTGARHVSSPEVDSDYRLRTAHETLLDRELFNYAAQNTGKHSHTFTTVTATVSPNGLLVNSGAGVATATGMTFGTFAEFSVSKDGADVYCETNIALNVATASVPTNAVFDVGMFRRGASTAFAPTDGVYFRFDSNGIRGVVNNTTIETQTAVFTGPAASFAANENHKYAIIVEAKRVEFWIDDVLYGTIELAASANAQLFRSATLPWSIRHANVGAVTPSALQPLVTAYAISMGGPIITQTLAQSGNRTLGSHQGLGGGTMGQLTLYGNSATPATAAGSNTAANQVGLGGLAHINAAASAATDFVLTSYQNPSGTIAVQGRRLVIYGVKVTGINLGAAVATTPTTLLIGVAFGHTTVSLATAETGSFVTSTNKAPRREVVGAMTWPVGAAVGAMPTNGDAYMAFTQPLYIEPGQFIATFCRQIVGTATASQSLLLGTTFDYGWE